MTPSLDIGCRVGGVTISLVSEHRRFGSDPPIRSDQRRGATLGHDLASRAIGCSSFPISISDGDIKGKGKVEVGIDTSPTA